MPVSVQRNGVRVDLSDEQRAAETAQQHRLFERELFTMTPEQESRAEAERLVELPEAIRAGILAMIGAHRGLGVRTGRAVSRSLRFLWHARRVSPAGQTTELRRPHKAIEDILPDPRPAGPSPCAW